MKCKSTNMQMREKDETRRQRANRGENVAAGEMSGRNREPGFGALGLPLPSVVILRNVV